MPSGIFKRSEQHKKNISLALKGRVRSEEHKRNLSLSLTGKKQPKEVVAKRIKGQIKYYKNHPEELKKRNAKISMANKDDGHWAWKGNNVSYFGLHNWVRRKLGKPNYCSNCKSKDKKSYEWANVSRKYKRELNDWIRLCVSCHRNYDLGKLTLNKS